MTNTTNYRTDFDYDGRPLTEDEILVLTPCFDKSAEMACTNKANIVTVHVAGRRFKAILKAVPKDAVKIAKSQFNSWIEDQLPAGRDGRCMLPMSDGTFKECPRKNGDNHPDCQHCPNRDKYEKKNKSSVSIEGLMDKYEYCPIKGDSSPESKYIAAETYREAKKKAFDALRRMVEISPKHGLAMLLMAQGISGQEFAERLKLSHDAANRVRQQILSLAPDKISAMEQIDMSGFKANRSKHDEYYLSEAKALLDKVMELYYSL